MKIKLETDLKIEELIEIIYQDDPDFQIIYDEESENNEIEYCTDKFI